MDLSQAIDIKDVRISLQGKDKASVIAELVGSLCESGKVTSREEILNSVMEREKIRSTGVGKGFAIPHCKTASVNTVHIAFGICHEPIAFDSVDGEPVKLIALLISPASQLGAHIQALAALSRIIMTPGLRDKLYSDINPATNSPWTVQDVYSLITS